jgi:hypothetical protein
MPEPQVYDSTQVESLPESLGFQVRLRPGPMPPGSHSTALRYLRIIPDGGQTPLCTLALGSLDRPDAAFQTMW